MPDVGVPASVSGRLVRSLLFSRLAGLERLHPATHRGEGAAEMRFELLQLFQGVGLSLSDDLVGFSLGVLDHLR